MKRFIAGCIVAGLVASAQAEWKAAESPLMTRWGKGVTPENAWRSYPRPQMVRDDWMNLNGLWQYGITEKDAAAPAEWIGEILVPFAVEAPLSGVGRKLQPTEALWYKRDLELADPAGRRVLLHFEAVDYASKVWVNGQEAGGHIGGNLPFSFDVTELVKAGSNEILVRVLDATDERGTYQLRGKQVQHNHGIWYTPVSGIWQTVWLECVPQNYIRGLKISTDLSGKITISPDTVGTGTLRTTAFFKGEKAGVGDSAVSIASPALWSPSEPNLYDLQVELVQADGTVLDVVRSYAGIREVGKVKDADGNWRLTLNGNVIFHWGPLDQGWWPDGLLTPPSEEAMLFDMKYLRAAGFNMIRKHIKVEPRRYYYYCDKMGFLVWQDQVSAGTEVIAPRDATPEQRRQALAESEWPEWKRLNKPDSPITRLDADWPDWAHNQWMTELKGMVDHLYNHPSIVVWTPFNERWGQHRTLDVGRWIKQYDPTRTINIASGGNFLPVGDIADHHQYPHPMFPFDVPEFNDYVKVVGEFGGHGWPVQEHLWLHDKRNWGYGGLPKTKEEYTGRYEESIRRLIDLKQQGVAAGVYTQTTDVEAEINGLITYDREVIKLDPVLLRKLHAPLCELSPAGVQAWD